MNHLSLVEEHPFQRKDGHALLGRTSTSRDDSVDGSSEPPTCYWENRFLRDKLFKGNRTIYKARSAVPGETEHSINLLALGNSLTGLPMHSWFWLFPPDRLELDHL